MSRPRVTPVTAIPPESSDTRIMQRLVDEAAYVLGVLHRMRDEVSANPRLFDPDAQERIDEAIARMQEVLRSAQSEVNAWNLEENIRAA